MAKMVKNEDVTAIVDGAIVNASSLTSLNSLKEYVDKKGTVLSCKCKIVSEDKVEFLLVIQDYETCYNEAGKPSTSICYVESLANYLEKSLGFLADGVKVEATATDYDKDKCNVHYCEYVLG